jgi:hypothetical protein
VRDITLSNEKQRFPLLTKEFKKIKERMVHFIHIPAKLANFRVLALLSPQQLDNRSSRVEDLSPFAFVTLLFNVE